MTVITDVSTMPYNRNQIALELERTALGEAYCGNSLRVAKDLVELNDSDRSLLDRYATGKQKSDDHVGLQDIAIRIRAKGAQERDGSDSNVIAATPSNLKAFHHDDDGERWLRLVDASGNEWDEPISGWQLILDLLNSARPSYYRHTDGREADQVLPSSSHQRSGRPR